MPVNVPACRLVVDGIERHVHKIVVHYDADFEHIAAVSGLQTRWVVPRKTVP